MGTPRQELIKMAATRLKVWRRAGRTRTNNQGQELLMTAHDALESIVDDVQPGTLGAAMRQYYISTTERALERLIFAVKRESGLYFLE